jgi:putative membrane protein
LLEDRITETKHQPELRDYLAAERTFLAWIRTGVACMGFGFVVARFGIFLQQFQLMRNVSARSYGLSLWLGTALLAAGVLTIVVSSWEHARLVRQLNRGETPPSRPSLQAVTLALFLAAIGLGMVIYLISLQGERNSAKPDSSASMAIRADECRASSCGR